MAASPKNKDEEKIVIDKHAFIKDPERALMPKSTESTNATKSFPDKQRFDEGITDLKHESNGYWPKASDLPSPSQIWDPIPFPQPYRDMYICKDSDTGPELIFDFTASDQSKTMGSWMCGGCELKIENTSTVWNLPKKIFFYNGKVLDYMWVMSGRQDRNFFMLEAGDIVELLIEDFVFGDKDRGTMSIHRSAMLPPGPSCMAHFHIEGNRIAYTAKEGGYQTVEITVPCQFFYKQLKGRIRIWSNGNRKYCTDSIETKRKNLQTLGFKV